MEKINEIYTSERKVLDRFDITDERAVALLLDAGYKSVPEARDACGRDLGFRVALLERMGKLWDEFEMAKRDGFPLSPENEQKLAELETQLPPKQAKSK
jgi:hypothetical protein